MTKAEPGLVHTAIVDLASDDCDKRKEARVALEHFGEPAVRPLIEALSLHDEGFRHEVFKVLGTIADPAAADVFLQGLEDDNADCRWLAAEGLVAIGREGLLTILSELTTYPKTERKLRGSHHVLSGFRQPGFIDVVVPVLRAFLSDISHIDLPKAAYQALAKLRH